METLNDLTPGQLLYAIFINFNAVGEIVSVTASQRIITSIEEMPLYNELIVRVEKIKTKHFGTLIKLSKYDCAYDYTKTNITYDSQNIYCFSRNAFIRELSPILKEVKEILVDNEMFYSTNKYYDKFMPRLIKMLNTNKSRYAEFRF